MNGQNWYKWIGHNRSAVLRGAFKTEAFLNFISTRFQLLNSLQWCKLSYLQGMAFFLLSVSSNYNWLIIIFVLLFFKDFFRLVFLFASISTFSSLSHSLQEFSGFFVPSQFDWIFAGLKNTKYKGTIFSSFKLRAIKQSFFIQFSSQTAAFSDLWLCVMKIEDFSSKESSMQLSTFTSMKAKLCLPLESAKRMTQW